MPELIDDFEDGDVAEWTIGSAGFSADNSRSHTGSWSGHSTQALNTDSEQAIYRSTGTAAQILEFEFYWNETSNESGFGLHLVNSNGDIELSVGSNNPEWMANGSQFYSGDGHDRWIRYTISFEWSNQQFTVTGEDLQSGATSSSPSWPLNHGVDVSRVAIGRNSWDGDGSDLYIDDLAKVPPTPATPDNATQEIEDDDTATATWTEDSSRGPVEEYELEVSTDGGAWQSAGTTTATSYTASIPRSADTIQFRVRAVNNDGTSDWAYTSTRSTNVSGLQIDGVDATSIAISWDDPDANDGTDVLVAEASGSTRADYAVDQSLGAAASTATVTGLEHGERYYVRVQATYTGADGTPSPVSNQVAATTTLPAPTLDSLDASTQREITLSLTLSDNSTDGDVLVERSTDGGARWTEVGTITDLSTAEWTDTDLNDGTEYTYRLTRRTDHAQSESGTLSATTTAPAPVLDTVTVDGDVLDVTGTDTGNAELRHEIETQRTNTTGSSWSQSGPDIAAQSGDGNTITESTAALLDGERYDVRLRTVYPDASATSGTQSATTVLPDEDQPVLGNGVEDEIAVDRETQPTDYGSVRVHYRETGAADWIDWGVVPYDRLDPVISGLEDGEEYEVRLRTETEHVDGAWTDPVAITTQFPGATQLTVTLASDGKTADLAWTDNSDNEDGFRVERRQVGVTGWEIRADLPANTTTYIDSTIPGTEYEWRIEAYTEHTTALSNTVTKTTPGGEQQTRISASGWSVAITHPVSGRVIRPDAINPDQVQFIPGPNTMPRIRMPVRRAPSWLDSGFDDNPAMDVHLDGEQLPIDELVDVEQEEGQTILVGEGGSELRTTVAAEYEAAERPTAATDLVSNNTPYNVVDNTATSAPDTNTVQSPSGESELLNALSPPDDLPIVGVNGGIKPAQTCFTTEAEDGSGTAQLTGPASFSVIDQFSDDLGIWFQSNGDDKEFTFTTDHRIPGSSFDVAFRWAKTSDDGSNNRVRVTVDGAQISQATIGEIEEGGTIGPEWVEPGDLFLRGSVPDLPAGTYTVRFEQIESGEADDLLVDVVAPLDTRYTYTYDNTTTSGYLDGPETHPTVDAVFDAYESAFSIAGGSATVTINDTGNNQALALSNDFGATYPISALNTTSVSGTFPDSGASLQLKATLSRYAPNGPQNATPRLGYDAQRLDGYTLEADVVAESLLIDESYNNALADILNQILGNQYGWKISNENGTTTFTVDEPGSTVADRDPEISESSIQKRVQTYSACTIKGSTIPVSGEQFQASTSFVDLAEDNILTGSEAVYDAGGTNYTRGVDYAMDYQNGQVRVLSGGNLSTGTDYSIDYRHQISATYSVPNQTGDTLTRTIPGVVSDRQAEQIAYVLAEVEPGVSTPRFEGSIVVPRLDVTFDPLEGLQLEDMDLPAVATPLSIRGEPQLTPLGLNLRLGSEPALEEALSNIREQVSSVADRS